MMNRSISSVVMILVYISQIILASKRVLQINRSDQNQTIPVWMNDDVEIEAEGPSIITWSFNNDMIAIFDNVTSYIIPNTTLLSNINAEFRDTGSYLILDNVNHSYSGTYKANLSASVQYIFYMTVHEVNLSSIEFSLINESNSCKAYLKLNDLIEPPNFNVLRMVNSSDLTLTSSNPVNTTTFEIIDSQLDITNNPRNITMDIQYIFTYKNFSTIASKNVPLNASLILQPNAGPTNCSSDNCIVLIQHKTNVTCVRNITYCLRTNDGEYKCNFSNNLSNLILEYPRNSTFANLSIIYDIIYAKYHFDVDITQQTIEATTIESTTMNSSPPEITTTQSGTSDHSIPSEGNTTTPPNDSEPLAGWKIALIVIGSVIGVLLIFGIIGFCLWKKQSKKTSKSKSHSVAQPSSSALIIRKSIPPSEPTNRVQSQYDQEQYPQSSSYNPIIRPTISQPRYQQHKLSSEQETEHTQPPTHLFAREQFPQSSVFLSVSPWSDSIDYSQPSRNQLRSTRLITDV